MGVNVDGCDVLRGGGGRVTRAVVVSAHAGFPPVHQSQPILGPRAAADHCFLLGGTCAAVAVFVRRRMPDSPSWAPDTSPTEAVDDDLKQRLRQLISHVEQHRITA